MASWLENTLQGEQGPQGIQGPVGPIGPQGPAGTTTLQVKLTETMAVGDVWVPAGTSDASEVKKALSAAILAGGKVGGVMLEAGTAGQTKTAAGPGTTVPAATLGTSAPAGGVGSPTEAGKSGKLVLNTATARVYQTRFPPPTAIVVGTYDVQGNGLIDPVNPGVASWVDNLASVSILDYGCDPTGAITEPAATETLAAFDLAYADAQATGKELLIPAGAFHLKSSRTISVPVRFVGRLKPATGTTITLEGPVLAPRRQIFENATAGLGTVVFAARACAEAALPEWWGASPDGRTQNGTTTANDTMMTSGSPIARVTGGMTAADVGKIAVAYEQTWLAAFRSTIATFTSATQVSLAANADKNISGNAARTLSFNTGTAVNSGTDEITWTAHTLNNGDPLTYTKVGSVNLGLTTATVYYARSTGANTITLHPTRDDAIAGANAMNLTASGSETHTLVSASKGGQLWIGLDSGAAIVAALTAAAGKMAVSLAPGGNYGSTLKINPAVGGAVRLRGNNAILKYVGAAGTGHFFSTDPGTDTGVSVGPNYLEHLTIDASKLLDDAIYMANESYPIRACALGGVWDNVAGVNALRHGHYHHAAQSSQFNYCRSQYTGGDGCTFIACNASRADHLIASNMLGTGANGIVIDSFTSAGGGNSYGGGDMTLLAPTAEVLDGFGLVVKDTGSYDQGGAGSGTVVQVYGGHLEGCGKSGARIARKGTIFEGVSVSNASGWFAVELCGRRTLPFNTTTAIDAAADTISIASHGLQHGDAVLYTKIGSQAIGLTTATRYYVRAVSTSLLAFYATRAQALADTSRIALTSAGGETHTLATELGADGSIVRGVFGSYGARVHAGCTNVQVSEVFNATTSSYLATTVDAKWSGKVQIDRAAGSVFVQNAIGVGTTAPRASLETRDGGAIFGRGHVYAESFASPWGGIGEAVNLLKQDRARATTPWTGGKGTATTVTNNAAPAPDGTITASRVEFRAGSSAQWFSWQEGDPQTYRGFLAISDPDTFTANAGTDVITTSRDYPNLTKVQVNSATTLPAGLAASTDYWTIRQSSTTSKLASSLANAIAGTAIDLTDAGTGTHYITSGRAYCYAECLQAAGLDSLGAVFVASGSSSTILEDTTLGTYADGVTAAGFISMGVQPGDEIRNVTEGKTAIVVSVDSETRLTTTTPAGQTPITDWTGDVYVPPQRVGLALSNGNATTITSAPSFAVDWAWRRYWIAGVTFYLADLTKKPRCNLTAATGGVAAAVVNTWASGLSLPVADSRLEPGPIVHTTTLPIATPRYGAPLNADHGGAPSLDAPGFWKSIDITKDTADGAELYKVPTDVRGFLIHRIFWEVTATAWTGGASSAIGVSSDDANYNTKGDLLGGATGDVATTLTANKWTGGTLGTKFGSNGVVVLAPGKILRFDRITSAFTAGTGRVWLYCSVLQ